MPASGAWGNTAGNVGRSEVWWEHGEEQPDSKDSHIAAELNKIPKTELGNEKLAEASEKGKQMERIHGQYTVFTYEKGNRENRTYR